MILKEIKVKILRLGNGAMLASEISLGCLHIYEIGIREASELIITALDQGINLFDHADIYNGGLSLLRSLARL